MRRRDLHALIFCGVTIPVLFVCTTVPFSSYLVGCCLTAAYAILLFTRPRMIRVVNRLRGRAGNNPRSYYIE